MAAIFAVNCLKKLFSVNHKIISHVVIRVLLVNWLIFNRVLHIVHIVRGDNLGKMTEVTAARPYSTMTVVLAN